jgi:hypothetical protein
MLRKRRAAGDHDVRVDGVTPRGRFVVVDVSWCDDDGERHAWAHLLELRGGRIVAMQDYGRPRLADAVARVRSLGARAVPA